MHRVLVLPSLDDQVLFENGEKPETHFDRSFATPEEVESYLKGMAAMDDLAEYQVLEEEDLNITLLLDGETSYPAFETIAERDAYKKGLEDGDGWRRPEVYTEKDLDFEELAKLVVEGVPKP